MQELVELLGELEGLEPPEEVGQLEELGEPGWLEELMEVGEAERAERAEREALLNELERLQTESEVEELEKKVQLLRQRKGLGQGLEEDRHLALIDRYLEERGARPASPWRLEHLERLGEDTEEDTLLRIQKRAQARRQFLRELGRCQYPMLDLRKIALAAAAVGGVAGSIYVLGPAAGPVVTAIVGQTLKLLSPPPVRGPAAGEEQGQAGEEVAEVE